MEKNIEYISESGLFIEGLTCKKIKEIDKYKKVIKKAAESKKPHFRVCFQPLFLYSKRLQRIAEY